LVATTDCGGQPGKAGGESRPDLRAGNGDDVIAFGHSIEREVKAVDQAYGENMLNLTLARGYVKRLLDNARVVRFLNGNYPDILAEFESIAAADAV